jgi:hypothetical protein
MWAWRSQCTRRRRNAMHQMGISCSAHPLPQQDMNGPSAASTPERDEAAAIARHPEPPGCPGCPVAGAPNFVLAAIQRIDNSIALHGAAGCCAFTTSHRLCSKAPQMAPPACCDPAVSTAAGHSRWSNAALAAAAKTVFSGNPVEMALPAAARRSCRWAANGVEAPGT